MDYSNDNSYDFSDQNESNVPNGSNFENGSDSGCGSSVDDYANSPYPNSPFASSAVYTSSTLGDLKLGLEGVTNFGESPNFLDMACLAKTRNSHFFGQKSSPNFRSPSVSH